MISVVQVKLKTSPEEFRALSATLAACNAAANGKPGSERRQKVTSKPIRFRPDAAQPFDARCLSWQHDTEILDAGTVSIWTTDGHCHVRLKGVRFVGHPRQVALLRKYRKGETDLIVRDGVACLIASIEAPAALLKAGPHLNGESGWLGVDLGIVNIASTSDGLRYAGGKLTGIRERVRLRKPQRVALHSWSFHQLGSFVEYKSERAGIPFIRVDPAYTSQTCHDCGNKDKTGRVDQATYICRACGVVAHADVNAARNIAVRGAECWAAVNQPYAA